MENEGNVNTPSFGGPWTEQKLEILRRYLDAYTTALKNQRFQLTYVDAFAGAGSYTDATGGYEEFHELHKGSARIALDVDDKPFDRLVFVEKDLERVESLHKMRNEYPGRQIEIVQGDANVRVPEFCRNMGYSDRAVVFLDPYATQVSWETVEAIAATKKIDCWILFPLMAVTRMMPTGNEPDEATATRLDRVFGGRGYWLSSYQDSPQLSMLGDNKRRERGPSDQIAERYRERLRTIFHSVATTRHALMNSKNAPLFELFFAAGNPKGARIAINIADHILKS